MATILRQPMVTRVAPRDATAAVRSQDGVTRDALLTTLRGQDTFFGPPGMVPDVELPNPRGPQFPIALRTHIDAIRLNLRAQDTFFAGAGRGPTYDWPNPRGPQYPVALRTHTWSQPPGNLAITTAQAPTYEFPNPRGAQYPVALRTHIDAIKLNLLAQDVFFAGAGRGPTYDWPNPRGPQYPVSLRTHIWGQHPTNLAFLRPFPPIDMPVPRGPQFPLSLRTHTDQVRLNLLAQDAFFYGAGRGPTYDWPNPRGPQYPVSLRTQIDPLKLNLRGKDTFFHGPGRGPNYDWPVPKGRPYPLALIAFVASQNIALDFISDEEADAEAYLALMSDTKARFVYHLELFPRVLSERS